MAFILNLTIREVRSSWRRLIFFFLCIALGVGSIVALRSLIQNLTLAVGSDARAIMTADLEISSSSPFTPENISVIESVVNSSGIAEARNETISSLAMARPVDKENQAVKQIELKGIEPPFPLVGEFLLSGGNKFDFSLLGRNDAVVARILLEDLNIKVGDKIQIGDAKFTVRDTFDEEPGGTVGFRLGARVFVSKDGFDLTGISQSGSRVRRGILYRTSDNPTTLVTRLREKLKGTTLRAQSYRETEERLGEQFTRTENYLSLTGLLILVLGGVGVWNVSRAFVEQKRRAVAVLKCLGASGGRIIAVYLLQILLLGLAGSLFGCLLAQLTLWLAGWYFAEDLPAKMNFGLSLSSALQGILLGVLISALFSALPLLQIRNIKPRLLLRDESNVNLRRLDIGKILVGFVAIAGLLALAIWQAGSLLVGAFFLCGLALTAAVLYISAAVLSRILRSFKSVGPFSLSQAINSLHRPGNQTRIILLAVGLGAFVVLAVQMLQSNLVSEFDMTQNQRLPSMFFVDIQKSQINDLLAVVKSRTGEDAQALPTIRARISYVNGKALNFQNAEVRRQQGRIGREFAVTYREKMEANEKLVAGDWWIGTQPSDVPEVSIEEDMARDLKVNVGDSITFDVSGRLITARIASIRSIDLKKTRTVFIFVFRPGVLEDAPQSFAATILDHVPPTERQRLQRELLDRFPNVQIFDVADIVAAIKKLVDNFVLAVSFVGGFVILSGILILIGSIALSKSQRIYENAILKTLGAKKAMLGTILIFEYGLLGFLSGMIGSAFAVLLSYAVSNYVLGINWTFEPTTAFGGIMITTILVMVVGAAANFDVLFRKPLAILRSQ